MKQYLPLFNKPSHYLGNEVNSIHKDLTKVKVHLGLAFPDLYEVGMSYYGQRILYNLVNQQKDYYAERVYAPSWEVAQILREKKEPLATLESDTPLSRLDILGFSLTNELAYTTCLYILDLGKIPFWSEQRGEDFPLVVAGGGVTFNAEPVAPFFDLMFLGDGEGLFLDFLDDFLQAKEKGWSKRELLLSLKSKPGIYIPGFFEINKSKKGYFIQPLYSDYKEVKKFTYPDFNQVSLQPEDLLPYGKVVHDRLTVEVARGCSRGCRFCHAGFIYRPVRERSLEKINSYLKEALAHTGYEELSFLSLSTGDFTLLEELFCQVINKLFQERVAISLPSLRVGSVSEELILFLSKLRKTGITLAPEAGTQRLRDVINKNIKEEEILEYTQKIFALGWKQIKLYFMLGLPTETKEDVEGIYHLCTKILAQADKKVRLTASVSLFVPKAHTPFQWSRQLNLGELQERIALLRKLFQQNKRLTLKWHNPEMSLLEGVFSRAGRELAPILVKAYQKGEILSNWDDFLHFDTWLQVFAQEGIEWEEYLRERELTETLPWEHLSCGVTKEFLLKELKKSLQAKTTEDCRSGKCSNCGVCDFKSKEIVPKLNKKKGREFSFTEPNWEQALVKKEQWRIWFKKKGFSAYLSQLELQKIMERALRRAKLPLAFSQGFHPVPLISFGRALPVGLESEEEIFQIFMAQEVKEKSFALINSFLPQGLRIFHWERIDLKDKIVLSRREDFKLSYPLAKAHCYVAKMDFFNKQKNWFFAKQGKRKVHNLDLKAIMQMKHLEKGDILISFNWDINYINPLVAIKEIFRPNLEEIRVIKIKQYMN
jgi:radical SAM family uncharacterized protein/radical SAM-linked protein